MKHEKPSPAYEWQATFDAINDAVLLLDAEQRIVRCNKAAATFCGMTAQKMQGRPCWEVMHGTDRPIAGCPVVRMWDSRRRESIELALGDRFCRVTADPLLDQTGNMVGAVHIVQDITERQRAREALSQAERQNHLLTEKALRNSEEKYKKLFTRSNDAIVIVDAETQQIIDLNDCALRLYGYTREEALRLKHADITAEPEESKRSIEQVRTGQINAIPLRYHRKKDGTVFPVEISGSTFYLDGRPVVCGMARDITERLRAAEEARRIEDKNRTRVEEWGQLMDLAPIAIWVVHDPHGHVITGNRIANQFFEADEDQNVSASPSAGVEDKTRRFFQNGRELQVDELPMHVAVSKGIVVRNTEVDVLLPSGRTITMFGHASPLFDAAGQVRGGVGAFLNITDRKRAEEELRRVNRTLTAHSHVDQVLMHVTEEMPYLQAVCRIIVEDCGRAMVWIGYVQQDEGQTIRPIASAGFEEGYLDTLHITWADTDRGRGPTGTAVRTGKPSNCRNMLNEPAFAPWRKEALRRGYASCLALPLLAEGRAFGVVNIYAREADAFSAEEIRLLSGLANDLAQGVTAIRLRARQAQDEKALTQLARKLEEENAQRREIQRQLEAYQRNLQAMAQQVLVAEERERRRLAANLHDDFLQVLALIQIKLSLLAQTVAPADRAALFQETAGLVTRSIQSCRSLALQLSHPALYDLGFVAGAQWLAEDIQRLYGLKVALKDDGRPKPLDEPIRVALFQCLRELLVNVAKHAQVDRVSVQVVLQERTVCVTVRDTGAGFEPATVNNQSGDHFGLFSVRERLRYLGGRMDINSAPGKGTTVAMTVPLSATPAGAMEGLP